MQQLELAFADAEHSIFSPSSSERWLNCPGSLIPNLLADDELSEAAAEGTVAHMVAETWLLDKREPTYMVGCIEQVPDGKGGFIEVEITTLMMDYVSEYVDFVSDLTKSESGSELFIETSIDLSPYMPVSKQGGTADLVKCQRGKLTIVDFKYGEGVYVEVTDNPQMLCYALGAFDKYNKIYNFKEIELRIAQPRKQNMAVYHLTAEDLFDFADKLVDGAAAAWKPNAPRKPSDKACAWCKVRATCPALALQMESDVIEIFSNDIVDLKKRINSGDFPKLPDCNDLTIDEIEKLYTKKSMVIKWFESAGKMIMEHLSSGRKSDLYKIVDKRATRLWKNESDTVGFLKSNGLSDDVIYPKKLITPAEAEKQLAKVGMTRKEIQNEISDMIMSKSSGFTFSQMSDRRPEANDITDVW